LKRLIVVGTNSWTESFLEIFEQQLRKAIRQTLAELIGLSKFQPNDEIIRNTNKV